MKTNELTGAALDWAVATCEADDGRWLLDGSVVYHAGFSYRPSTDWSQGGPIIEREIVNLTDDGEKWIAEGHDCMEHGSNPLIAAMRCYVASKLGHEVEVPEKLIKGEPCHASD